MDWKTKSKHMLFDKSLNLVRLNELLDSGQNEIRLLRNCELSSKKEETVEISADLIVDGDFKRICCGSENIIFNVTGSVKLKNILFEKGCRIKSSGNLEIDGCKFEGSLAIENSGKILIAETQISKSGSCIIANDGEVKFDCCRINENPAEKLIENNGDMWIVDCEILKNDSSNVVISNAGNLEILYCAIAENASEEIITNNGELMILKSKMEFNAVEKSVINNDKTAIIEHSVLKDNLEAGKASFNILNNDYMSLKRIEIKEGYETICNRGRINVEDPDIGRKILNEIKNYP